MSPSSDYAASILLCSEDSAAVLDLEGEESDEISGALGPPSRNAVDCPGTLWIELPLQSDDCIEALLEREVEHLPMEGYRQRLMQQPWGSDLAAVRRHAIDWIWMVREHYKFGPLTGILSVNYLDRFLSLCDLHQAEAWVIQLLAVACLSLAAKMEETIVGEAKPVFETRTIHRMEILVLNTLGWRMQAVTACSFIDYYLHKFSDGDAVSKIIFARSIDLILSFCKVAEFLIFRPSEVAASVALLALGKHENSVLGSVATCCKHIRKDRVLKCLEVLREKNFMGNITPRSIGSSPLIVPHSPIGVLDAVACESQQSEETSVGAPSVTAESSPARKKRKTGI
ncbi:hypothetical protein EJB05_45677 [Eragrostis curvula]|uniref:Cyclin N-terminal domain-containing protein n=1 Tax=Eragrostis curvula TaxID=38414 RepID=A0A5J9TL81_9POAL|nr:hypothetical protein EJB05_45677 [Eragrostis curvula]